MSEKKDWTYMLLKAHLSTKEEILETITRELEKDPSNKELKKTYEKADRQYAKVLERLVSEYPSERGVYGLED